MHRDMFGNMFGFMGISFMVIIALIISFVVIVSFIKTNRNPRNKNTASYGALNTIDNIHLYDQLEQVKILLEENNKLLKGIKNNLNK